MAAFEQKMEMRGETGSPSNPDTPGSISPKAPSDIQIVLSEDLETTLIDIVKDDFSNAKSARNDKNYGITDKGEKLSFDEWYKRIKDLYSGDRIPKTIPWKFCYSKDTEILTNSGWKLVKDVSTVDMVYSMNPIDRRAKWMPVIQTISNYYDEMVHFKGKSVDLIVSKDHQMFLERNSGSTSFRPAIKIHESYGGDYIPLVSSFESQYYLPEFIHGFKPLDWMRFLGWFISEGFVYEQGTVSICQDIDVNPKKCGDIGTLLQNMGLDFSYSSNKQFLIRKNCFSKECLDELVSLGKAPDKFIPRHYLDLPVNLLEEMFSTMMAGDGTILERTGKTSIVSYYTSSIKLADQVQELAQKIGKRATISVMHEEGTEFTFKNGTYAIAQDVMVIRILNKKRVQCNKLQSSIIPYNDYAYCLETPYHTVFVRRNGVASWCGNCSNRSLRIAASVLDLMHSRLFPAVWNEDLARWRPGSILDVPKSDRITKFMDWWIRVWSPLRPFFDGWVKYATGFGDALTETTWEVEQVMTSEMISEPIMDETGQALTEQDGSPAMIKMPKVNRIERTKSRFISKDNVYFLKGSKNVQKDPVIIEEEYLYKDLEDLESQGFCINVTDKLKDKLQVPEPTGNITDSEKARLKDIKLRNMPVKILRWYGHYDVDSTGFKDSIRILVSDEYKIYLGGVRMRDITKSGKRPLDFTKYDSYLDRMEDMDGEGVLHKIFELALELDAIFNQMTDAHTLSVLRPFFYDPSGDLDAPAITMGPNKGIPVTDPQKNVYFPDFAVPTERLINAIKLVLEFIERLTAASDYQMGKESDIVGGSGTATRTQAIMQSAEVRFTLPSERLRFGAGNILTQHFDLIQLNIPLGFEQRVIGEKGEQIFKAGELTDEGLSSQMTAYLLPDPTMGSKKTARDMMMQVYSILIMNPLVATDPTKLYMTTFDTLKAQGYDDAYITRWLGPMPDPDMIDDPEDENTLMLQGDFKRVTPQLQENHLHHIQVHMDLEKSPHFQSLIQTAPELTKQISDYNKLHIQQHMEMMAAMLKMMQSMGGKGGSQSGQSGQGSSGDAQQGTAPGTSPDGSKPGLEQQSGPMGQALNTQRNGKVAGSQGGGYG